jgi:uncharacterized glyoxalase superfamily protein PhnB
VSAIITTPAYRDPERAITFLVEAFGFEQHATYRDEEGALVHAELTLGGSMVMPATPGRGEYGALLHTVADAGKPTSGCYVVVEDVRGHHERARDAGAEILTPPRTREHGGEEYLCRDLEGHLWTFGSYDPWS